jgi:hypothetical protein
MQLVFEVERWKPSTACAKELWALATAMARLAALEGRLEVLPQGERSLSGVVSINRGSGMQVFIVGCLLRHLFELVDQLDVVCSHRSGASVGRLAAAPLGAACRNRAPWSEKQVSRTLYQIR